MVFSKTETDREVIMKKLETKKQVKFKRGLMSKDDQIHIAKVSPNGGLVVIDDDIELTFDSFYHLYIDGYIEKKEV